MKRLIINTILLLFSFHLLGQEVSEALAVRMATHYFQTIDSKQRNIDIDNESAQIANHKVNRPEQISPNGRANMWLVPVEAGWVLLSSNIKATPILAYIPSFEKPVYDSLPPAAQELLDGYEDYIAYINEHETRYEADSRWLEVINQEVNRNIDRDLTSTFIGPLLSVEWGQSGGGSCATNKIYNKFCPAVVDPSCCNKAPAGCVAVAIAQIMWYWNWPYAAQIPQTIGGNDTLLTFYDWSQMPTSINDDTNMASVNMIASFLRDCGYKLGTNYGAGGSSAEDEDAKKTLKAFGYDENTIDLRHKWMTSGWTNMLRTNIDNGQPVYYSGYSKSIGGKGHAFVVDGYQTGNSPIYHINWGWIGLYNGWYNIDDAYVNDTIHYEHWQSAIFGIRPAPRYCTDLTITTVESPKFCIAQAGTVTLNGVQMSNITDGRIFSETGITLTAGTSIANGCHVLFDIKPIPCDPLGAPAFNNHRYMENEETVVEHITNQYTQDPPLKYLEIYSIDGKLVRQSSNMETVISSLSNGVYIVKAIMESGDFFQSKIFIQK